MKRYALKTNSGIALVAVLGFCTALLGFVAVMHFNMKSKTHTQHNHYENSRALWAANSAIQLALYKYRVLPAEYYYLQELELKKRDLSITSAELVLLVHAKEAWMQDFKVYVSDTPAALISESLAMATGDVADDYAFGVTSFDLISSEDKGYVKDYLRIKAWGRFKSTIRELEDMIEVKISK